MDDTAAVGLRERIAELLATPGPLPGARNYEKADEVMAEVLPVLDRLRAERDRWKARAEEWYGSPS